VLGGDVLVFEVGRLAECLVEDLVEGLTQAGLGGRTSDTRQFFLDLVQLGFKPFGGNTDFFEDCGDDTFAVLDQRQQQMDGQQFGIAQCAGAGLRLLHCLLRFDGQFFPTNSHCFSWLQMTDGSAVIQHFGCHLLSALTLPF